MRATQHVEELTHANHRTARRVSEAASTSNRARPSVARPQFSIIIPTLDESTIIAATIAHLRQLEADAEIVVADGNSRDDTTRRAAAAGARVVRARRGRGWQMNAGAAVARGGAFLFLHADCRLPADAFAQLRRMLQGGGIAATFRIRYPGRHPLLRCIGALSRIESKFTSFGEGGLCVRREAFESSGGFAPWPLFEDVEMLARLRHRGALVKLDATVTASPRRYLHRGVWRQQLRNGVLLCLYHAGVGPETLARRYDRELTP